MSQGNEIQMINIDKVEVKMWLSTEYMILFIESMFNLQKKKKFAPNNKHV